MNDETRACQLSEVDGLSLPNNHCLEAGTNRPEQQGRPALEYPQRQNPYLQIEKGASRQRLRQELPTNTNQRKGNQ
jgi:hypothetical protein